MKNSLAVVTPTYNRADTLPNAYASLIAQSDTDFVWYIIDDGSTDGTRALVASFADAPFDIRYIHKENGGKHTALNTAFSQVTEELFLIMDSDDTLLSDAVKTVKADWQRYATPQMCGMSYYRLYENGDVVGTRYPSNNVTTGTFISFRINGNIRGDNTEVWRTDLLKERPFPVYKGEKFMSETVLWSRLAHDGYHMAFIPKGIYVCEYRDDGLTNAGRSMRLKNPLGMMENSLAHMYPEVKFSVKCKHMLLYIATAHFSSLPKKEIRGKLPKDVRYIYYLIKPFGFALYVYWKKKFAKREG